MSMTFLLLAVAAVALVGLVWWYRRLRSNDEFDAIVARNKATATMSSRAELVDGGRHIAVALTLDPQRISYQNADLDASIEIRQIDEVEYGSDLVTGATPAGPVLRLRSHGRAIEFVLDAASAERWSRLLPAHRMGEEGQVRAV